MVRRADVKMKYKLPPQLTLAELEREFASGDGRRIQAALWSALRWKNCVWVESRCLFFLGASSASARRGAALVLGDLARVHGERIDLINTREALRRLAKDADKGVRAAVKDSLDTVMHRLRLHKERQ
jgi:hypothetical protein